MKAVLKEAWSWGRQVTGPFLITRQAPGVGTAHRPGGAPRVPHNALSPLLFSRRKNDLISMENGVGWGSVKRNKETHAKKC